MMKKNEPLFFILVILLVAVFTRLYHLDTNGLWGDEGYSVHFSNPHRISDVVANMVDDLHPPLYFVALSLWRQWAGDSVIALRLIAVFSAFITIALIYRLGADLFGSFAGLTAALILTLADKHILLSQEVRHYPSAFMWMALSSLLFWRWMKNPRRFYTLVYTATFIAAVYTHYYTALIFVVQVLYAFIVLRPFSRVVKLILLMGLSSLAFAPWLPVAFYQLHIRPEGILHSMPLNRATLDFLVVDFLGRPPIILAALIMIGLASFRTWHPQNAIRFLGVAYVALWLLFPSALTVLIFEYVTLLTDRNMSLLLLPIALLAGQGIASFRSRSSRLILVALVAANSLASVDSKYSHPPLRAMAYFIADNYPAGEPVLLDIRGDDHALSYHLRERLPVVEIYSFEQLRRAYGRFFLGAVQSILENYDGFWLVYWGNPERYELDNFFSTYGYQETAQRRFYHLDFAIDLYHYDRIASDDRLGLFSDSITLHKARFATAFNRGDIAEVNLWWSTNQPLEISYSVSVFLLNQQGILVTQRDSPPQNGAAPTNSWQSGLVIFDRVLLDIPQNLPSGEYILAVKVYNSVDGQILFVQTDTHPAPLEYLMLTTVTVR